MIMKKRGVLMLEKNKDSIRVAKALTEELVKVWQDKDFIIEVMNAIDGDLTIANEIIAFLRIGPELVPMEIFDKISTLKQGFIKERSEIANAKRNYLSAPCEANMDLLIKAMQNNKLFHVYEWDITEEEKEKIKTTKMGNSVRIETPMIPVVLTDDSDNIFMSLYSSQYEIGRKYRPEPYCNQEESFEYVKLTLKAIKMIEGKVAIILDPDSDDELIIPEDIVAKWIE